MHRRHTFGVGEGVHPPHVVLVTVLLLGGLAPMAESQRLLLQRLDVVAAGEVQQVVLGLGRRRRAEGHLGGLPHRQLTGPQGLVGARAALQAANPPANRPAPAVPPAM